MTFNCDYCNSTLASVASLKIHQKSSKRCLAIQGAIQGVIPVHTEFKCVRCDKNFTTNNNLSKHIITCKNTDKILHLKITELETKLEEKNKKVIEIETMCNMLLYDKRDWKQTMDKLTNSAISKSIVSNTTIFTRTDDEIKNIYDTYLTASDIEGGIDACSKFIVDKIITDSNGNKMITITDKSRYTARYKLPSGEIVIDNTFKTFTEKNKELLRVKINQLTLEPSNTEYMMDENSSYSKGYFEIKDDKECVELKKCIVKRLC